MGKKAPGLLQAHALTLAGLCAACTKLNKQNWWQQWVHLRYDIMQKNCCINKLPSVKCKARLKSEKNSDSKLKLEFECNINVGMKQPYEVLTKFTC